MFAAPALISGYNVRHTKREHLLNRTEQELEHTIMKSTASGLISAPAAPLVIGCIFLLTLVLCELLAILWLNDGKLVYTLDDPYIHLALSENILRGHYGVNLNEFSAPSSSILWPFILVPFSAFDWSPLILNIASALLTVYIINSILRASLKPTEQLNGNPLITALLVFIVMATNMVGLIFTGMEHSLQVLLVVIIASGLIHELHNNRISSWLLAAIIVAPLIRYENLSVSVAALSYLFMRGYHKQAAISGTTIAVLLGGYSLFLLSLGLDLLPTSVIAKSGVVEQKGGLSSLIGNLKDSFTQRQGVILMLLSVGILTTALFSSNQARRQLAYASLVAAILHFLVGRYGWYHRYEIYILTFLLLIQLSLAGPILVKTLEKQFTTAHLLKLLSIAAALTIIIGINYISGLRSIPIAANNIYEQQYSMHRFVTEYYQKPVAVNDIGFVSSFHYRCFSCVAAPIWTYGVWHPDRRCNTGKTTIMKTGCKTFVKKTKLNLQ